MNKGRDFYRERQKKARARLRQVTYVYRGDKPAKRVGDGYRAWLPRELWEHHKNG